MQFEYNLVPCEREPYPRLNAPHDLTHHLEAAQTVVEAIQPFFRFQPNWPIYSGKVHRSESGALYVQIWKGEEVERSVAFQDLGYTGVLNIDYPPDDVGQYRYLDLVKEAHQGFHERGAIQVEGVERDTLAIVEGPSLTVTLNWRS